MHSKKDDVEVEVLEVKSNETIMRVLVHILLEEKENEG